MSPDCRDMTINDLVKIDEQEAYAIFCQFRWPETQGEPVCPHCGIRRCYASDCRGEIIRLWRPQYLRPSRSPSGYLTQSSDGRAAGLLGMPKK
jgi:hypothetical protein